MGTGDAAQLFPLGDNARRRALSCRCQRASAGHKHSQGPGRAHAQRPQGSGPGRRVRDPVAARPRHRAESREEREAVPDLRRRSCAQALLRGSGPLLPGPVPGTIARCSRFSTPTTPSSTSTLARHYGIPGVSGPEWRRVAGVKKVRPRGRPGTRQRADDAIGRIAHQSGAARQLAGGNDAGRETAQAAAQRATITGGGNRRARRRCGRWWKSTRTFPSVPSATSESTRSASPWRSTIRIGRLSRQGPWRPADRHQCPAQGRHEVRRHRRAAQLPVNRSGRTISNGTSVRNCSVTPWVAP